MKLDLSLTYKPRVILSIVSPSRSGSTIIKHAICQHPALTSLAGEEEPYYKLAKNGYPWDKDDTFGGMIKNPELVRALIANEVHGYNWLGNRLYLQKNHIEEPPYVSIPPTKVLPARPTEILVLKTPQNCYRKGLLGQLYPDAKIMYLRVHRGGAATVNGLLDGWAAEGMFEARRIMGNMEWWKFDMYPGWSDEHTVLWRCLQQYWQAKQYTSQHSGAVIEYEAFLKDPMSCCCPIWDWLGLSRARRPDKLDLPELMCTDPPDNNRWKEKRPWLADLGL